ncbi:tudor domain-containing protein [Pilobolus umbonatus]|nr:tudor domain-containing protein [Pilobolus umbonatus]
MVMNKAVVKNVLSGDTVILRGKPRANGPPLERLLALSNVQAPRLGNMSKSDEPFGYAAREFLRKLLVGKEVNFVVEYATAGQREYGTLYTSTGENVAELGVKAGWLKVRGQDELLLTLQAEAEKAHLGVWNDKETGIRDVAFTFEQDPVEFLKKYKGKPLEAVIEQVRDAASFRVLLILPNGSQQWINMNLSGIKVPRCKREDEEGEPFGEEAKYFVESRLLQRSVKVTLEGQQTHGFMGSIAHPAGNITEILLSQGFAQCVDWSIPLCTCGPAVLRNAEKLAKEKKLRVWRDFVATKENRKELDVIVVRVINGDTVIIKTKTEERKIQLASIKQVPRQQETKGKDIKETGYQLEAREFLRKKLIGKQVRLIVDYNKPAQDGFEARDCGTILLNQVNIAEQLVARGLATVIRHRKDDDKRSHCYDKLLIAEKKAQDENKGIHSTGPAPVVRIVDASENAARSQQFLTFFKRRGQKLNAIVEFVSNGSRVSLWIPKENCKLTLILSGIRAPRVGGNKSEPFGQEALDFVSPKIFQHDVEVEIENVDKVGNFVGTLFIQGENLSVLLLKEGLATLHEYSANDSRYTSQLYAAEREAQTEKKNIWSLKEEAVPEVTGPNREYIDVVVSDIISGSHFYVQKVTEDIPKLEKLMKDLSQLSIASPPTFKPRVGEVVCAQFTEDDCWYRARIRKMSHEGVEVVYVDFGNSETLSRTRLRPLPVQFQSLKPQAHEAVLSFIKSPERTKDYGYEAIDKLRELTGNKQLVANVDARIDGVIHLTLYDFRQSTSAEASINLEMVKEGFAVVKPKVSYAKGHESIINTLEKAQEEAIKGRLGMFEYGDITGEDDLY